MSDTRDMVREVEGVVRGILPGGKAVVELADGRCIEAELSARIKVRFVGINLGDRVQCELSPYDPGKARVIKCV